MKTKIALSALIFLVSSSSVFASADTNSTQEKLPPLCNLKIDSPQQIQKPQEEKIICSKLDENIEFVKHITIKKKTKIKLSPKKHSKTVFMTYRYPIAAKAYSYKNGFYQTGLGWIHKSRVIVPVNQ